MPGEGTGEKPGFFRRGDSRAGRGSRGRGGEGVDGVGSWQGWVSAGALWRVSVGSALLGGWPARTGGDSPAASVPAGAASVAYCSSRELSQVVNG